LKIKKKYEAENGSITSLIWLYTFKNKNPKWFKLLHLLFFSLLSFIIYKLINFIPPFLFVLNFYSKLLNIKKKHWILEKSFNQYLKTSIYFIIFEVCFFIFINSTIILICFKIINLYYNIF
jgi:hypothetical protein